MIFILEMGRKLDCKLPANSLQMFWKWTYYDSDVYVCYYSPVIKIMSIASSNWVLRVVEKRNRYYCKYKSVCMFGNLRTLERISNNVWFKTFFSMF